MPQQHVIRFGPFALDPAAGELRKHGIKVRLHGQPAQVLGLLLERPGEMVTREELRARLWDSATFVDFDHGLHAAVNKLRFALNDAADHPRYIETIPKRGYRFIGAIESSELSTESPSLKDQPAPESSRARFRLSPAVAILVVVTGSALWWSLRGTTYFSNGSGTRPMLAVLPFENLSDDPDQEYFSDGLTEELITGLGQLDAARLGVIARTSVMSYKRTTKRVREISRELGVDYVVEGSVRRADARIRIAAQLVRASDETHLWAGTYERTLGDLLPIQREIARAVAGELQIRLPGADSTDSTRAARQVAWEAHEATLRGRHLLERRTADGNRKARDYFARAIALEPSYVPAHLGLADAHILAVTYADAPAEEAMNRARASVSTALAIDAHDAAAQAWLGVILTERDWDWTGAERAFRRALELDPNFAYGHKLYAEYLSYIGRFDRAIAEAQLARRLDPLSIVTSSLVGFVFYRARQYDDALEALYHAIELDPNHPTPYLPLGLALSMQGRHDEAIAALEKGVAASERSSEMLAQLALAHGRAGHADRARVLLAELKARASAQHVSPFVFALAYTGLDERETAIEELEKAYHAREWYLCVLKTEPTFDSLREDPRFQDLLRRLGLPS